MRRAAWIEPEQFYLTRCAAHLSRFECACELGVSVRTVRNWENGFTCIPYAAFKLLRILSGWELPFRSWQGFSVRGDVLWTPEGKPLYAWEMNWLALTFSMARHWCAERGVDVLGVPASGYLGALKVRDLGALKVQQARAGRPAAARCARPETTDRGAPAPSPRSHGTPPLLAKPAVAVLVPRARGGSAPVPSAEARALPRPVSVG